MKGYKLGQQCVQGIAIIMSHRQFLPGAFEGGGGAGGGPFPAGANLFQGYQLYWILIPFSTINASAILLAGNEEIKWA